MNYKEVDRIDENCYDNTNIEIEVILFLNR